MSESQFRIIQDDLSGTEIARLLQEHLAGMHANSPPGSCHVLDLAALRVPEITFWSAWKGDALAGCGALREISPEHGEIKSMRTRAMFLRQGVGAQILETIIETAHERGYDRLSLETGSGAAFDAAHHLYRTYGFSECEPFGSYRPDPFSRFFTLSLAKGAIGS